MASGRGSGKFSGYVCVKFVFFTFNVIFWLLGCAILGIGIWLHIAKGNYASIAPSFNFLTATALCIAAGAIVLVVGFFGCCGAIMENQCMLLTYFLLVVVIFILEVVAGILAFVFAEEVERVIQEELLTGIKDKYRQEGRDEQGLRDGWDQVQTNLKCCGVTNYTDWYNIQAWPGKNYVPDSCCKDPQGVTCGTKENPSFWYTRGCLGELKYWLKSHLYIVGVVGITVGVLQVLGMVAAMALFCCLRNDKYYE